ncbi:MAG: DUF924 family protein [Aquisalimonadaceae bacterium]
MNTVASRHEAGTEEILGYWFGGLDDTGTLDMRSEQCRKWHAKSEETDLEIRELFLASYLSRLNSRDAAADTDRDRLATILLFDQFPRNMFRDTRRMYEADTVALELCLDALQGKRDESLPLIYRLFMYMPLMHSESLPHQERTLKLFSELPEVAQSRCPQNVPFFEMAYNHYARAHHEIIRRFGRFPHRNALLGRDSTPEEIEFLAEENSSF